jgi:hypothetical protein
MRRVHALSGIILASGLLALSSGVLGQQNPIGATGASSTNRSPFGPHDPTDASDAMSHSPGTQQQLERSRQSERQKRMIADTNRLLALAAQLRSDSDKANRDTATVEDVRKVEEIEKLAHNVKERMKN